MIGIDEVGRGAWAGPLLVVAARQAGDLPLGLKDSKLLSKKKRGLFRYDIKIACDIGEGWVDPAEVDELGLSNAMKLAVERALKGLHAVEDEEIVMDGNINYCPDMFTNAVCIIDADATYPIVSAASIYAKVLRDQRMTELSQEYPDYGFDKHVGYGTKQHQAALQLHGVTAIHRKCYAPVRKASHVN